MRTRSRTPRIKVARRLLRECPSLHWERDKTLARPDCEVKLIHIRMLCDFCEVSYPHFLDRRSAWNPLKESARYALRGAGAHYSERLRCFVVFRSRL